MRGETYRDGTNGSHFFSKRNQVIAILRKVDSRSCFLIIVSKLNGHINGIVGRLGLCFDNQAIPVASISEALGRGSIVSVIVS